MPAANVDSSDYYKVLGVERKASEAEISKARSNFPCVRRWVVRERDIDGFSHVLMRVAGLQKNGYEVAPRPEQGNSRRTDRLRCSAAADSVRSCFLAG